MVNDVLHGERIVDGMAARVGWTIHRVARDGRIACSTFENRDRSNFNKIRGEFAASFPKTCIARRTAFSNVAGMVAVGE
jgi:hypothetical protein